MATQADGTQVSLLSLTGALDLYHKGLFRGQYKQYWFWFDEQTCSLKYYKNQDTYLHRVGEPLGMIDLQCAKVTPGITSDKRKQASNIFHINVDKQEYVLAANDSDSALKWIQRLQGKRGEFIKTRLGSRKETSRDVDKHRTFVTTGHGVIQADRVQVGETSFQTPQTLTCPAFQTPSSYSGRNSISLPDHDCHVGVPKRSATISLNVVSDSQTDDLPSDELSPQEVELPTLDETDEPDRFCLEKDDNELQEQLLKARNEILSLKKVITDLKQQLNVKDAEILELSKEVDILKEEIIMRKVPQTELQMENESLKNIIQQYKRSLKSLDDEIELHKLSRGALDEEMQAEQQKVADIEKQLRRMKGKYVGLLSDQFKVPLHGSRNHRHSEDGDLLDENKYNKELLNQLREEGDENPFFETYCSAFEDHLGDQYDWEDGAVTQKYLCRLLHSFYNPEEQEKLTQDWDDYLSQFKQLHSDKVVYQLSHGDKLKLRGLLRRGLPFELRTHVWTSLIHYGVGRLKETKDRANAAKNMTYYQALLSRMDSVDPRLISDVRKDLHRTLPTNRHFRSGGAGIERLERVLLAYSIHNEEVGYCQSMNMIAATGLLFLEEETAFWFLVLIIDKLMPSEYYTSGLLGAQADLGVMKKLVSDKLPRLNSHLRHCSVDVTLVTFSWFLTVFTDAFPTESALRVLDCYMLEGHKILYRVSLAVLKLNEHAILNIGEQVSVLVFLKEIVHHMFNIEEILNVAFTQLRPFPRRNQLISLHHTNFVFVKKEWNKKEKKKATLKQQKPNMQNLNILASIALGTAAEPSATAVNHLPWDYGCVREDQVWLCCNEKDKGTLGIVSLHGSSNCELEILSCKVDSRTKCLYHDPSSDTILLGALDYMLQAIDCKQREILWSYKFTDSILDIVGVAGKVIIGLANGNISMLKCVDRPCEELLQDLYISSNSVSKLVVTNKNAVWCGAGKTVTVVNIDAFEIIHSFTACGTVSKMKSCQQGVWISVRSSTVLSLYDATIYLRLLEVDYTSILPAPAVARDTESRGPGSKYRITSLHVDKDMLYVGNGSGELIQFRVIASVTNPQVTVKAMARQNGKPVKSLFRTMTGKVADTAESGGLITTSMSETEKAFEESLFYTTRRHTQARPSLRPGRPRSATSASKPMNVYKLEFMCKKNLGTGINEPTSFLLPLKEKILAGVNRVSDFDKCVAITDFNHPPKPQDESQTPTDIKDTTDIQYLSPPRVEQNML